MDCDQFFSVIGDGLTMKCEQHGDDLELTLPIQGLDGYELTFWCTMRGQTWYLSDEGHLADSLVGIAEDRLTERVAVMAGDLPVSVVDRALVAELLGETPEENGRIVSTVVEAALGAWALRLEQSTPALEMGVRDLIANGLTSQGIPINQNVEVRGRSGLIRRFDLAAGRRGLLRAADTGNTTHFQHAAELYMVYANDIRAAETGIEHNYVFAWNTTRLDTPNPLVLQELRANDIYPTGDINEAVEALAA